MTTYAVFRGEYPFDDFLGYTTAPEDQPDLALSKAINAYKGIDPHPVVAPITDPAARAAVQRDAEIAHLMSLH